MTKLQETLGVFRNGNFRNLWLGSLAANTGTLIQTVAAAWLMTLLSSSQMMVALVQAAASAPLLAGGYVAGIMADNYDRRRVMLVAQLFMMASALLLMVLYQAGAMTPWLLLALTFLLGSGTALFMPSWQASIGDLVPQQDLAAAVSLSGMGLNLTRSLAPAIGGALIAFGGVMAGFVATALCYPALIWALFRWKPLPRTSKGGRETFRASFGAGLRYVLHSPFQLRATLRASLFGFAACAVLSLLPLVASGRLNGEALIFGVLFACFGMGATLAALGSAYIRALFGTEGILRLGFSTGIASLVIVALSPWAVLTGIAVVIAGASWLIVMSLTNVSIQLITPRWVVGRVVALFMSGVALGTTAGAWVWGMTAERFGPEAALLAAAALMCAGLVWGLVAPMPAFALTDMEPADEISPPQTQIPIGPRSGPITITIEHEIAAGDVPKFLQLMERRRHLRLRGGALDWSLHRDIEMPQLWLETYHFHDWAGYLRHRDRRVAADVQIFEEITGLHRGVVPQRIHRTCGLRHLSRTA